MMDNLGFVHSFQSMGTLDGPGVRFVVFMQGCNLRCKCCHNPDTWQFNTGDTYTATEVLSKVVRFKSYFSKDGGITVSGGEPLMQASFVSELFKACHDEGINTCLDTSGSVINEQVKDLLSHTDRVLLDIKYTNDEQYIENVGCSYQKVLEFLELLDSMNIATTLRQVIIPTLNDNEDNILRLKALKDAHKCVDKIELLAFKKICQTKYDDMKIDFPFAHIEVPNKDKMTYLNSLL